MTQPRIALIHATPLAVDPINNAFKELWPQAVRQNLLDDSLSEDLARDGQLTDAMVERFITLSKYVIGCGADAILFTCSAFGKAIEQVQSVSGVPTLKPNEAMFEQALAMHAHSANPHAAQPLRLSLLATFNPSIDSMSKELLHMANSKGIAIELKCSHVPHAMQELGLGNSADHNRMIAQTAQTLEPCDAILLAQFSMAQAAAEVSEQIQPLTTPVLSSPVCAVHALKAALGVG